MALNDDLGEHRGRPRTSHTDENCAIVEGLLREDRKEEKIWEPKRICKEKQFCNSLHLLDKNTTVKECLNL
jgi:hypothetical protein